MKKEEYDALVAKLGSETADLIKEKMAEADKIVVEKIATSKEGMVSAEDLNEAIAEKDAELKAIIKEQSEAIKKLNSKPVENKGSLLSAFAEKQEELNEAVKNQSKPFIVSVDKAAVTMGEGNTIGSGATQYSLTENTGDYSGIRRRGEKYLQAVTVGSMSTERALWFEETDDQGTPVFIAESTAKTQLSNLWVEKTAIARKIAVFGKVSTELMADLPQLISFIQGSMVKRLEVATETQLLTGLGTGVTLSGAKTLGTAFSAGDNALAIDNANEWDVLDAIALQVEVAYGTPNAVFINPSTWAVMKSLKDTTGQTIWRNYVDQFGDVNYAGMKIITSTAVTAGEFIGGDMSVLKVLFREQLNIQIGLDGNDFTNNLKTIVVEQRLVQYASANDVATIVKGTFAAAAAALETV